MTYRILYIEDEKPDSLVEELQKQSEFHVEVWKPDNIEDINEKSKGVDLIILDFRLDKCKTHLDGPSYAQALRTKGSRIQKDIPIVLFSMEVKITEYYKDFTSQDLFDFSIPKEEYFEHSEKYNNRLISLIKAYKRIKDTNKNLSSVLNINETQKNQLDYRIQLNLKKEVYSEDIYAFSSFVYQNLIRSIGVLIGEDVLSARLGISRKSKDWNALKETLEKYKYSGIFSDSYDRWWAEDISNWFQSNYKGRGSLRRLNAEDRCSIIKQFTSLNDLSALEKINERGYISKSSNFWTVCKATKAPIDYIDGFELYERELFSWQESEYISFLGKSSKYKKFLKPSDNKIIIEMENKLRK